MHLLFHSILAIILKPLVLLGITYEIKPGIFDEKRGIAALLIKNSGFYFIFNPCDSRTQDQGFQNNGEGIDTR